MRWSMHLYPKHGIENTLKVLQERCKWLDCGLTNKAACQQKTLLEMET